jgi:hypothetical protein
MFEKILTSFNEGLLLDKGTLKEESMVHKKQTTNQTRTDAQRSAADVWGEL